MTACPAPETEQNVARIVALLHERTPHDFTLYKPGTLQRRIARRMAIAGVAAGDTESYLAILQGNQAECDLLAEDMLINVTGFFRDPKTFEMLAEQVVPGIVAEAADQPIRIWIAGCSTGEETYSLAMLFLEQSARVRCGSAGGENGARRSLSNRHRGQCFRSASCEVFHPG
jgi:two-component system CheB/CheR fusion protein